MATGVNRLVHRLEGARALDKLAEPGANAVSSLVRPRWVRNLLSGTNLGHPLHPALTDLTIGAWGMATLLDRGGQSLEPAADLLVGAGVVAAVPTALAGLNDWSDTIGGKRRVGLVHAAGNVAALSLYVASGLARRSGHRPLGRALALAGFGVLTAAGYLGGYLSFARGVNVNHTAFEHGPREWTPVLADEELPTGTSQRASVGGVEVLLARVDGQLYAVANTCTHAGGPLDEGELTGDCVSCPWHGSIFRLADGAVVRGPATVPQPAYEVQVRQGKIEVRAAQ